MTTIQEAVELLKTTEKALKRFVREDAFNLGNVLEGWISLRPGKEYGALVIDMVNGEKVIPQVIWGMPKLHYPFATQVDGTRVYHWPVDALKLHIAEKWDGTNICHYAYEDAQGKIFYTFKTRLTPVAGNGDLFGNFAELVQIVTSRHDWLSTHAVPVPGMSAHCYELCGYRNPHMVKYDFDINMIPLCTIMQKHGDIIPYLETQGNFDVVSNSQERLTQFYEKYREQDNQIIKDSDTEEGEFPLEGKVFYVFSESLGWVPVKCKPQIIEDIHWSRGGIPENKTREACFKALERFDVDDITLSTVEEILLEDYPKEAVNNSTEKIKKGLSEMRSQAYQRRKIRALVLEAGWAMEPHVKGDLMRMLAPEFDRNKMRHVFSSARAMGLIKEN